MANELTSDQFIEFHNNNPRIWELFQKFTFDAIDAGHKRIGAGFITERIRWEVTVNTTGDSFKIRNGFRAFYSRMFMAKYPQYAGLFRTNTSIADEVEF